MSDKKKKKRKQQESILQKMLDDVIRKSLKATIDQALDDIFKDFK
jgi:hypothetical protein